MAGFETIVRPVVFPNIRPQPARSLPPADDPEKGFAIIKGNPASQVDLTYSYSMSANSNKMKEIDRTVDVARVYQEEDDGAVNTDNYVDIEVAKKITLRGAKRPAGFKGFNGDDLVPTYPGRGFTGDDINSRIYRELKEQPNVEIRERDKRINTEAGQ
jgi:hypothetical protein